MGFFKGRKKGASGAGRSRKERASDRNEIVDFNKTRRGVEAYLEPRTSVTTTTVVFVAHDGEWIRKHFDSPKAAGDFARKQRIPLYDTNQVGYPQRMRDWTTRRTTTQKPKPSTPRTHAAPEPAGRGPEERKAVQALQFLAEVPVTDGNISDDDAVRLLRAARKRVHPDLHDGERAGWDQAERAARVLGLD